jgi:hypothetical protein
MNPERMCGSRKPARIYLPDGRLPTIINALLLILNQITRQQTYT